MKKYYELQPLRLQSGWKIEHNNFSEYDPAVDCEEDAAGELCEDLLQLSYEKENVRLIIDLGWYLSDDREGYYLMMLVKNNNWANPLVEIETTVKKKIIENLEKWVCYGWFQKYL